ncbi:MAG TPA: UDP-N-acetylmuramoyl-L-alanine--D-glutamate ligase [Longimicrobiales bacterium]|nr:UDP-N-acetylmuramoyl-L-alanine--D-glutamate ligase [Longimicrobiales bacterium]
MTDRVGVLGMARSGRAAARLALGTGADVYVSDAGDDEDLRRVAEELRSAGADVELGGHSVDTLARCDLIVVSPGIPPTAPVLADARLADVPRVSELEYGFRELRAPVIAVTGTNGKTTVTAWIAHLLDVAGARSEAAGNIGNALSEVALRDEQPEWVVVEASSYQLGLVDTFAPRVGVLTNLAPDHLDRYPGVAEYYADKGHLFDNARPESTWVLNGDDVEVLRLAGDAPGRRFLFHTGAENGAMDDGVEPPVCVGFVDLEGRLTLREGGRDEVLVRTNELRLLGGHNHANALAAALAAFAVTGDVVALREGLRSFPPLRHRLEPLGEVAGVLWVNDSKATNVASCRVAVESMTRPTVLLLGGRHKGEDYGQLRDSLGHVKRVLAYGEAADQVAAALDGVVDVERMTGSFEVVVRRAAEAAVPGDAVLLAPACASFDMFRDYEERGELFARLVSELSGQVVDHG